MKNLEGPDLEAKRQFEFEEERKKGKDAQILAALGNRPLNGIIESAEDTCGIVYAQTPEELEGLVSELREAAERSYPEHIE